MNVKYAQIVLVIIKEAFFPYPEKLCEIFNPLNTELNPICHLLALLGAHHILHVSGLRVNHLTTQLSPNEANVSKYQQ
jgi:hypothetical protein